MKTWFLCVLTFSLRPVKHSALERSSFSMASTSSSVSGSLLKAWFNKKKELWTHLNFRLWGASLQRLEYIIRVIFYTEWIEGEVSFTYSPIKLWRTLTLRRSSGNDWSGCILQIAFALFNSPLHWSVSCTFLCSRRLHFCLKKKKSKHDK